VIITILEVGVTMIRDTLMIMGSPHWSRTITRHWQTLRQPCVACGEMISYSAPRVINGKVNPNSLAIAHVVSVKDAKAMGWTMTRIYSRDNSMPVHRACAPRLVRTGSRVPPVQDQQVTSTTVQVTEPTMIESRW
jgi:hypothetical protein